MSIPAATIRRSGHTIDVYAPTTTTGSWGEHSDSFSKSFSAVEAWVQDASARVRSDYEQRSLRVTKSVYVAQDLGIQDGWRVVHLGASDVPMVVRGVVNQGGLDKLWRLDCEAVAGQTS